MGESRDQRSVFPLPSGGSVEITDATLVSIGAGYGWAGLTYTNDNVTVVFEVRDGVPGATSVTLRAAGDKLIRAKDLTAIRLDQIRNEVYAVVGVGWFTFVPAGSEDNYDEDNYESHSSQITVVRPGVWEFDHELTGEDAIKAVKRATTRRHKITPEFLSRVAEIHQGASEGGRLAAVKAAFVVNERQALRYIAAARKEGLIK